MTPRLIFLVGPPGAGKTTHGLKLAQEFGFKPIESSALVRRAMVANPQLKKVKEDYNTGQLFPGDWTTGLLKGELKNLIGTDQAVVLSGALRTLYEVKHIIPYIIENFGLENIKIIHLDIGLAEAVRRNSSRRVCEKSAHPLPDGPEFKDLKICPLDQSPIVRRKMDQPEIIQKRFENYLTQTRPAIEVIEKISPLTVFYLDGERPVAVVYRELKDNLEL